MRHTNNNRKINTAAAVETDWRTVAIVIVCAVGLAAGFFFAARQHFLSMDIGFKNSKLRKQLEDLESEKRRLLLAREISLSPIELKKASKSIVVSASDVKVSAQTAAYISERRSESSTGPATAIRSASAVLAKPKPAAPPLRAEAASKTDATITNKRAIELVAAINLR